MSRKKLLTPLLVFTLAACGHPRPPAATPAPKEGKSTGAVAPRPTFSPTSIDRALRDVWAKGNVTPAPRADDATFLRRAYIDIVGAVPPPDVTKAFLDDPSTTKRDKLVETLLASPQYAEHWTRYWDGVLLGREARGNLVDRGAFRYWLRARFAANAPWDRVVFELVSATGQNGLGGPKAKAARAMGTPDDDDLASVNGAVNWTLRFEQSPQDLGGSAARIFLGVQIQCAQCHDHKTEKWTQDDFRRFSSGFFRARVEPLEKKQMGATRQVRLVDAETPQARFAKNAELGPLVRAKATALDGTSLEKGVETRKALATWMTSKDNPWFAKAFVNRMWGHFLGRGFYDPVDDIRPSNPPTTPELLDAITADFVAHDFDVKHLIRTLCATEVYQLAASANAKTDAENKLWGRFHLVPLGPEELLDAILRVTELERTASASGIKDLDALRENIVKQYGFLFDVDEEDDEPDYSGTVSQALALLNGALVGQSSRALPGSLVADLIAGPGSDADKLTELTLRVLARRPTPDELTRWTSYVTNPPSQVIASTKPTPGTRGPLQRLANKKTKVSPQKAAYEDIVWSMLNSSEFTFNH